MTKLIDLESYPVKPVLDRLLQDKTTKQNIIFATDAYLVNGPEFSETSQITADKLLGFEKIKIQPRVEKAVVEQLARTRKKAEVFTPSWIVNKMNNHCDKEWFGKDIRHNFRQLDALPYAKDGTLQQKLDELFG